ncbi:MAG: hypothetical protein ACI883_001360 [Candidatus Azotimanducaceae bacterium]|jgi:hypothetical protein|tara:strand:- start:121 stop:564 length:444 start_codon:yes stop_codon:yes gene_type:complete
MGKIYLLIFTGLFFAGCAEYLPISGGQMEGVVTPAPQQWGAVADDKIIQFETNAGEAYSVNLWVVEVSGSLHVFAGDNRANWVEDIEQNANVRLRAGDSIFEFEALRVIDAQEFELFAQAWETKYGNRPRNENIAETYLYRLRPQAN